MKVPGEGLLSKAYAKQRAGRIDPKRRPQAFMAGNPLPFDSQVKEWRFWVANIADGTRPGEAGPDAEPIRGTLKDTTHIAVIDQGRQHLRQHAERRLDWRRGVLGRPASRMSVRGEQFWLDKTRAAQLRPRVPPTLYAHAQHRPARRRAVHGARARREATTRIRPSCRRS